ncbi:WD domain, G-beta repeat-containing protein [Cardiosporidium cionae]|uniref:WD domain, G-beta repeat-containing protein n=1 Tax=Cardiosporidium cionae TaxID=476202 RepID=A0ABQ7JE58_9APIC|nr:WD domain, G-beta repeat-containing protein [Cardiosporidium cionae]|eukprot:KAF8822164.1 WD domain, G-beta repeat-containing protein [Cardiosporidium cionae]
MSTTMVSTVLWIPPGSLDRFPYSYYSNSKENDGVEESSATDNTNVSGRNAKKKRERKSADLEDTDDEDDTTVERFFDLPELTSNAFPIDPNLNLMDHDTDDDEANEIREDDCVLVATSAERDAATMEVYVYNEKEGNFYVHHDIIIPENPLCSEYVQVSTSNPFKAMVAIGSCDPSIQLWDLNCIDRLDPTFSLINTPKKAKRKSKSSTSSATEALQSSVMALHASPLHIHLLASGSADACVRIWDLSTRACLSSYKHHTDKVQAVKWHPIEGSILLSTSFDRKVYLMDTRQGQSVPFATLPADAECALWNRHRPMECLVGCEDGHLLSMDIRNISLPSQTMEQTNTSILASFTAHESAITGLADSAVENMLVSCSLDGIAKVWDLPTLSVKSTENTKPIVQKALKAGPLFCCNSNIDIATLFSFGGEFPVIWDVRESEPIREAFHLSWFSED